MAIKFSHFSKFSNNLGIRSESSQLRRWLVSDVQCRWFSEFLEVSQIQFWYLPVYRFLSKWNSKICLCWIVGPNTIFIIWRTWRIFIWNWDQSVWNDPSTNVAFPWLPYWQNSSSHVWDLVHCMVKCWIWVWHSRISRVGKYWFRRFCWFRPVDFNCRATIIHMDVILCKHGAGIELHWECHLSAGLMDRYLAQWKLPCISPCYRHPMN